jgi:hypothetical protein
MQTLSLEDARFVATVSVRNVIKTSQGSKFLGSGMFLNRYVTARALFEGGGDHSRWDGTLGGETTIRATNIVVYCKLLVPCI